MYRVPRTLADEEIWTAPDYNIWVRDLIFLNKDLVIPNNLLAVGNDDENTLSFFQIDENQLITHRDGELKPTIVNLNGVCVIAGDNVEFGLFDINDASKILVFNEMCKVTWIL